MRALKQKPTKSFRKENNTYTHTIQENNGINSQNEEEKKYEERNE